MHTRSHDIVTWLRSNVSAAGAEGLVVPLTGSLGSVVASRLCQMAREDKVVAVMLGDTAASAAAQDAQLAAEAFQFRLLRLPLELTAARLNAAMAGSMTASGEPPATADREWTRGAGLRQRLQMSAAYFVADSLNYLVVGGLDRTDLTIGTFTRYGESAVDLLPLGTILKSDVVALAEDLNVPPQIVGRARADSLAARDHEYSDSGLTHTDLERYLANGPDEVAPATALRIERLMRGSDRRRGAPLTMADAE